MKRDLTIAAAIATAALALGLLLLVRPQASQLADLNAQILVSTNATHADQIYTSTFPARLHAQRVRFAPLNRVALTADDTTIEQRFLIALDALVRRNGVGVRPLALAPTFVPLVDASTPAPMSSATPGRPGQLPPTPAPTISPGPIVTAAAPGAPGVAIQPASPQLLHNDGTLELIGPWQSVLHSIDQLTALPVLLRINTVTLTRESGPGHAAHPQLDARIGFSLYRINAQ
jgi:hypothetical protein